MGRHSTGAVTTNEVCKLELKLLLRDKLIQKGSHVTGSLTWTNGSSAIVESVYKPDEKYVRLKYILTEYHSGKKFEYDYKIQLVVYPSNLGKGEVMYFLCPETGLPCRILYRTYGSHIYKSRNSYKNRIYYSLQTCSKKDRHNSRYWKLDRQLKRLEELRKPTTYKGKPTKRALRVQNLETKQWEADHLRWSLESMPVSLQKILGKNHKF
ncbi:GH3 auxin-responsive promoter family protein [Rhodocytophaga rosea]|uniref:GH3 auxin-responsive promoter family protein n=1 Tax=Rhodocytophaga rosea TaxID=2704465 RepID=A0A6C0GV12_9BACT|nr:GH3 auxin-responsive promoter family protein [Rhodocytophaga rosea]QHT71180.1 GH3 auxin-responsive promoter family protein [Rhodocytophaga rosea]